MTSFALAALRPLVGGQHGAKLASRGGPGALHGDLLVLDGPVRKGLRSDATTLVGRDLSAVVVSGLGYILMQHLVLHDRC